VVAREDDEDDTPARRPRAHETGRLAMASPPAQRGGLHLITSAMAAEVYTVRHGKRVNSIPVSYTKPSHPHETGGTAWKLHATGPQQAPPGCHKNVHGKTVCGPERL
jgi:hypothetical protein